MSHSHNNKYSDDSKAKVKWYIDKLFHLTWDFSDNKCSDFKRADVKNMHEPCSSTADCTLKIYEFSS